MEMIIDFFKTNDIAKIILDGYFTLLLVSFVIFLIFRFKKALTLAVIGMISLIILKLSQLLGLVMAEELYSVLMEIYLLASVMILAPDLRKLMETHKKYENKTDVFTLSTQATKEAIVDAVFNMSSMKVGALITFEQHNSLDQYAERAITLNSDISRELLEQIFIKDSPLHDGGVIIRGNKIVCAGAYYVLTQDDTLDKTVGSRHRAAVGVSEITDSLTVIVSEETGKIQVANAGFMITMHNKTDLLEYLNKYLGR